VFSGTTFCATLTSVYIRQANGRAGRLVDASAGRCGERMSQGSIDTEVHERRLSAILAADVAGYSVVYVNRSKLPPP
jgi:hypothetical protein